ncbi:ATP-binding protein [Streptomyces sp. MS2.AVA.5]|uniref:ATP-binding protein n=1 Tax=Streptomyces achmelvichensis TaxID=3134111 RepID=A0ACC6PLX4_9ACTN
MGDRLARLGDDPHRPGPELRIKLPSLLRHDSQHPLQSRPPRYEGNLRLCVSELVSNALVHGTAADDGFLVKLVMYEEVVRLEVHDSRRQHPEARWATDTDTSGRGLIVVNELADSWGVQDLTPSGKIVWSNFKDAGRAGPGRWD